MSARPIPYYSNCVDWPHDVAALSFLVDHGLGVTRDTFRRRVNPPPVDTWDAPGLHPPGAWHVHYYGLRGLPIYWYTHSCIEYIFAAPETIQALLARAAEPARF